MVEFLGIIGFCFFAGTLIPFVMRSLRLGHHGIKNFFTRYHHSLALAGLVVLSLHGMLALVGKSGWQWGKFLHANGHIVTGVISWLVMLAVVVLAMFSVKQNTYRRNHCWLVGLLIVLILYHIS